MKMLSHSCFFEERFLPLEEMKHHMLSYSTSIARNGSVNSHNHFDCIGLIFFPAFDGIKFNVSKSVSVPFEAWKSF